MAIETAISSVRPIQAGVPQGSCLSPSLYAVFTDDISPAPKLTPPSTPSSQDLGEVRDVMLALFADDSAYEVCSKSIANFEFSRVTYIRISIFLWRYVGTHVSHLCRQARPF